MMQSITRRQALTGTATGAAALAIGAGTYPAVAAAADHPRERVERAIAELQAAFAAYYPRAHVEVDFNGVTPADMYSKPQPGGYSYGADSAHVLVFASVYPWEHGRVWKDLDREAYGR